MATEVAVAETADQRRSLALLKAVGLDKAAPEQRELALAIAKRYDLDLLLKHLVLIEGRPYITRDGLLWVAHRSGQLDGIEVTDPEVVTMPGVGEFWRAEAAVFRKDMSRPFRYAGRYPTKGGNQRFGPEMAVKVAEVMALRRAFNVSAPVLEERWDLETRATADASPEPPRTLADRITERRESLASPRSAAAVAAPPAIGEEDSTSSAAAEPTPPAPATSRVVVVTPDGASEPVPPSAPSASPAACGDEDASPMALGLCAKPKGHPGLHGRDRDTWPR